MKTSGKQRSTIANVLLLMPFIFTFAVALDIYVPNIPMIHHYFHASSFAVQLTISVFLLLTGIGQLLVGPISDSIGRRKTIFLGTVIFLLGSIVASLASTISILIFARMIQGFGACAMMVSTFAMVRDLYDGDESAKIYSLLNASISLSPLLAPSIGGYLGEWYSWRASFVFLAVMACLLLLLVLMLVKETLSESNREAFRWQIFANYRHVIKSPLFLMYTFCASAGFAGFLTFFSVSSYIIISLLHVPAQHFGVYFAAIGIVFFIGSIICSRVSMLLSPYYTVLLGTALMVLAGLVMLLWYLLFGLSIFGFMMPMMFMGIGGAFMMGASAGGAIAPFPEMAGAASAVFGASEFIFAFIISSVVLAWRVNSTLPLAFTLIILGLLSAIACLCLKHHRQSRVGDNASP